MSLHNQHASGGFNGWAVFWIVVALIVIGALAYAAYNPNWRSMATTGTSATTTENGVTTTDTGSMNSTVTPHDTTPAPAVNPNDNTTGMNPNVNTPANNNTGTAPATGTSGQ